jgi:uncharacterized membrane protein
MDSKKKALRILIVIMMILSSMSLIALVSTNVAALNLGPADLSISVVGESKKYGNPGQWVSFTLRITNSNSNYDAWVNLTLSGGTIFPDTGQNWQSSLEKENNIVVRYSSYTDVRLDVRVGKETFNTSSQAEQVERVEIDGDYYDKGDSTYTVAGDLFQTVDVEVLQKHQFGFTNKVGEPDPKKPNTARQVQFNFTINNTGNGEDTFTFKVENAPGTPFMTTEDVDPYSTENVKLTINNIPKTTEAGIHFVTVKAFSENSSVSERQAGVNVQIDPTYNLDLTTNEPITKSVLPDNEVNYNFTIKNKGNDEDQVIISAGIVGSAPGWIVSVIQPQSGYTILRNDSAYLLLEVAAPANATYPTIVQSFLNISSKNDPTVYQYIGTIKTKITQEMEVSLVAPPQGSLDDNFMASFPVDIYNKGNGEDTFEFELFGNFPIGELWNYEFNPPTVTLGPEGMGNDHRKVYFNLTGPEDAQYGNFKLKINATSDKDSSVMDQREITISVGKIYNIDITRLAKEKWQPYPGDTISIRVRGVNVGNFKDTFNFDVDTPAGAASWISDFDPEYFDLDPDQEEYTYFNLTIDDDAPMGIYLFEINCTPSQDSRYVDSFRLNISVKRKYEIELSVDEKIKSTDPGSPAIYKFTVTNKGTGGCNVTMDSEMLSEFENYMSVQFTPATFTLPNSTAFKDVIVRITPSPSNPLAPMNQNGVPINITADIKEKEGGPEAILVAKVKINQTYDVDVFVSELYKNIEPGSSGWVIITVTNDGNGEDSFGITPTPPIAHPTWKVKATPTSAGIILQGDSKDINITITIPVTESVVTDNITINVTSISDSSRSLEKTIRIIIEETKNFKFVATDFRKEVEPGSYVHFSVEIENTGTVDDTFTLDVVGDPSPFIDYELAALVDVQAKKRNATILNISVSDSDIEKLPKMDNITVEATNTESFSLQRTFTIDITAVRAVRLSTSTLELEGRPNAKLIYNISIENTGTGKDKYALSVLSNPPYSQWATLKAIDTKQLDPGEVTFVNVEVKIPSKQSPSPPYGEITILAESKENPLKNDTADLRVIVEQVFKVQVTPAPTTNKVDPGENVTFEISIKNTGSAQDTFELIDDRYENSDSILFASFSSRYLILEASETQTVTYTITAVKEPEAAKLIAKIRITAESLNDTADTPASDTEEIVVEVQPTVEIELQADKIKKDVTPELSGTKAEVTYDVTIVNNGLADDKFDLAETNNHGFVVELPASPISVKEGESQVITIKILIDNNAPRSSFDYNTNITVTSRNDPDTFETITLKTRILQTYGVELQAKDKNIETEETLVGNNRIVTFEIDVRNIGTGEDTIKFELSGDYDSWGTLNDSSFDLNSKELQKLEVEVRVPRETLEGDYSLILKAISRGDDDKYEETSDEFDEIKLTVQVTQFYELELDPGETMKTGVPGDTVDFNFFVNNRGNGEDTANLQKRDYNIDWLWTLSQKSPKLQPTGDAVGGDKREIKLTVDIPTDENGKNGFYNISIYVYSTPPSGKEIQNNGQPIEFTVKVDPVYEMDLILDYPTSLDDQKDEPGRKIDYKVTLKNKGNTRDTFKLSVTGSKSGWVDLPYSTVTIGEYKSRIINFTVNIPDITEVDVEDIEAQKYQIKLRATSEGDSDKYDELILNPTVEKEYSVELEPTEIDIENNIGQLKANPNADPEYAEFSLTIKNEGNTLDRIQLSATNTGDWNVKFKTTSTTSTSVTLSLAIGRSETFDHPGKI